MIESLTGQGINVRHACRVLGVSESGYYAWKDRPDPPRTLRRIWLASEIADVHKASGGTYGEMRVTAELRYGRDIVVGHNAVGSLMRELGIKGLPTRRLPKGAKVAQVTHLDLVRRVFRRDGPNQLWMTDITEHPTREGKVYCCVVLDAFSRLVVGWSVESTQTTVLVTNALGMATARRDRGEGLVIHSDHGVQPELNRSSQQCVGDVNLRVGGEAGAAITSKIERRMRLSPWRLARRAAGAATAACVSSPLVGGDRTLAQAVAARCSSSISAGVFQPSVFLGLAFRAAATAARSSAPWRARSVPLGKYWRKRPLVFSLVARCQGLCGSQK